MRCRRVELLLVTALLGVHFSAAQVGSGPYPDSRFTVVEGIRLHYRHLPAAVTPVGATVLLVHGFAASTFTWRHITDTLQAAGYEVVAVDVPPYGYSDKNPSLNQSFTARALLLRAFIRQEFPGRRWHLVGHSMGGGIVEALTLVMQENVESAVFVDGTIFREITPGPYRPPWFIRTGVGRGLLLATMKPLLVNRCAVRRLIRSALGRKATKEETLGYLKPLKVRGTSRAILKSMAVSEELFALSADSIRMPVLAIWGDRDRWVPAETHKRALVYMADARLEMIAGAAHSPAETHTEEFKRILLKFLAEYQDASHPVPAQ